MALVRKTARLGDLVEGHLRIQQQALGRFDAPLEEPAVRRPARRLFECSGEVAARQAALACQLFYGDVFVEAGIHPFFRTPLLPRSQAAADRWNDDRCISLQEVRL